jgi:hypothetical protein
MALAIHALTIHAQVIHAPADCARRDAGDNRMRRHIERHSHDARLVA